MTEVSKDSLLWQRGLSFGAMPFADANDTKGVNHVLCW
jgi:hypothetical protein